MSFYPFAISQSENKRNTTDLGISTKMLPGVSRSKQKDKTQTGHII